MTTATPCAKCGTIIDTSDGSEGTATANPHATGRTYHGVNRCLAVVCAQLDEAVRAYKELEALYQSTTLEQERELIESEKRRDEAVTLLERADDVLDYYASESQRTLAEDIKAALERLRGHGK